jgi:hypothetical protein
MPEAAAHLMLFHISENPAIERFEPRAVQSGVDFRVVPNLWPLRDAVAASTLQFSIIRMRNALPRGR